MPQRALSCYITKVCRIRICIKHFFVDLKSGICKVKNINTAKCVREVLYFSGIRSRAGCAKFSSYISDKKNTIYL